MEPSDSSLGTARPQFWEYVPHRQGLTETERGQDDQPAAPEATQCASRALPRGPLAGDMLLGELGQLGPWLRHFGLAADTDGP